MIFVVLEDSRAPLFTMELLKDVPSSSVVRVNRDTTNEELKKLNGSPLFTKKWFAIVEKSCSSSTIKSVLSTKAVIILYATKTNLESKLILCKQFSDVKVVDLISPSKEYCTSYVEESLGVSHSLAEKICSKSNYFLPSIEENIMILKSLDTVDNKAVNLYVSTRSNTTTFTIFYFLVGLRDVNKKAMVKFLYDFRYAFSYIKTSLLSLFETSKAAYRAIESGELTVDNLSEFLKSNNKLKATKYFLERVVIDLHPHMSYDTLVLKEIQISKCSSMIELLSKL